MDIANNVVDIFRYSDIIYQGEVAAGITIQTDPESEAILTIELDSAQTGTVYLRGSTTETVTFTATDQGRSASVYTTLAGVTPASLTGIMTIKAENEAGEPVRNLNFQTQVMGVLRPVKFEQRMRMPGYEDNELYKLYVDRDTDIIEGDILEIDDGEQLEVKEATPIYGIDGIETHKQIMLRNKEQG
jgi:hypothetical protein